jgi:hypothetical protein
VERVVPSACAPIRHAYRPHAAIRVIGLLVAAALWLAVGLSGGCSEVKQVGGDIGGNIAEWIACPTDLIDCGHVYECAAPADNPLGHVEICVDDETAIEDVEAVYGDCAPTPRHEGLCSWCCGANCGRGANAYDGAWCP